MMNAVRSFVMIITMMFSQVLFAGTSEPVQYDQSKTTITVTKEQPVFIIKLQSNPTTGYTWLLRDYDKALLTPVKHQFIPSTKKLMGAPGYEMMTFKVKPEAFTAQHQTSIKMIYARPWEENKDITALEFKVIISSGN